MIGTAPPELSGTGAVFFWCSPGPVAFPFKEMYRQVVDILTRKGGDEHG